MSRSAAPPDTPIPFSTTLHVRDHCLCLHIQRAARALARRFDEALRPLDLTNGQFSLLMSLNRPAPAPLGSVANLLAMDRTTLTAALKPLQRRGLLRITRSPQDARARLLAITPKGSALLARALPTWHSTHAAVESTLPTGAPNQLRANLQTLSSTSGPVPDCAAPIATPARTSARRRKPKPDVHRPALTTWS